MIERELNVLVAAGRLEDAVGRQERIVIRKDDEIVGAIISTEELERLRELDPAEPPPPDPPRELPPFREALLRVIGIGPLRADRILSAFPTRDDFLGASVSDVADALGEDVGRARRRHEKIREELALERRSAEGGFLFPDWLDDPPAAENEA